MFLLLQEKMSIYFLKNLPTNQSSPSKNDTFNIKQNAFPIVTVMIMVLADALLLLFDWCPVEEYPKPNSSKYNPKPNPYPYPDQFKSILSYFESVIYAWRHLTEKYCLILYFF